jgi:superfamily I DNA/RNA helicase
MSKYSTKDLERMSPMKLGETGSIEALPFVVNFLDKGSVNEVRLAASAIKKIARKHKSQCLIAVPNLINALDSEGPQARQYVLNTLIDLNGSEVQVYKEHFEEIVEHDPKSYNREAAKRILFGTSSQSESKQEPEIDDKPLQLQGEQRKVLSLPLNIPIQIKGAAGSGKSTCAIYRALHLISSNPDLFKQTRVGVFSFTNSLKNFLEASMPKDLDASAVTVITPHAWMYRFLDQQGFWNANSVIKQMDKEGYIVQSIRETQSQFPEAKILNKPSGFFEDEIDWIKGRSLRDLEEYKATKRTGRGSQDRVTSSDKEVIWKTLSIYTSYLRKNGLVDFSDFVLASLDFIENRGRFSPPFTHIVVDEAQDLSPAALKLLRHLVDPDFNSITIIADTAQSIYNSGFSWSDVGINIRGGRTIELTKNYRNTKQIALAAKQILSGDPDYDSYSTSDMPTREGSLPVLARCKDQSSQMDLINRHLSTLDLVKSTVVVAHRGRRGAKLVGQHLKSMGHFPIEIIGSKGSQFKDNGLFTCTLSSLKGLTFDHVILIDLNAGQIPYMKYDDGIEEEEEARERRLLYMSMTRAKDSLLMSSAGKPSPFLYELDDRYCTLVQ